MDAPTPGHGTGMAHKDGWTWIPLWWGWHRSPASTAKSRAVAAGHRGAKEGGENGRMDPKAPMERLHGLSQLLRFSKRRLLSSIPPHGAEPLPGSGSRVLTPPPPCSCSSSHPAPKL